MKFMKPEVSFLGHVISKDGLKPDSIKVEAINKMPPPNDKKGVQRFIATVNFLQRFSPNLSQITSPIRTLLKDETVFFCDKDIHGKIITKFNLILNI